MTAFVRIGLAIIATAVAAQPAVAQGNDPGRLYGRVLTMDGEELTGFIRWDSNEGHWTDHIDATKRLPRRFRREAERLSEGRYARERSIRILGVRFSRDIGARWTSSASSVIRFGHIRRLEVLDDDHALLVLKSGEEQELQGSTDLGRNLTIVVQQPNGAEAEIEWDDLDVVEFLPAPASTESPFGERLYGTLTARGGDEFEGWITWDRDEVFAVDELNGRDGRRRRDVSFGDIASIERGGSSRAYVTLKDGQELEMSGTNDVNSGNRGIFISDRGLGRVEVKWNQFREVRFHEPPNDLSYDVFDGGRRLQGTVYTEDGDGYSGDIRWDNDEEWTWEALDGESRDAEFDVEFGLIRSIAYVSRSSVRVTLLDGREFVMRGSNDVNDQNKGIFIKQADGETVLVDWEEFDRVEFRN